MRDADIAALKAALSDVPGIDTLSQTNIGGRMVFGFNGVVAAVDPSSSDDQIIAAIRKAADMRAQAPYSPAAALSPATPLSPQTKATTMSNPAPAPGSFAASIKAMMDEARAGVAQARADGLVKVKDAVGKLNEAKDATAKVAGNTAKMIEDEAASVLSELGQLSNDL